MIAVFVMPFLVASVSGAMQALRLLERGDRPLARAHDDEPAQGQQ